MTTTAPPQDASYFSTSPSPRVAVALSGGVDSSVAALLLRDQGLTPVGVTLKLQRCEGASGSRSCCGIDGVARARAAARRLGIKHYVLDGVDEFERTILAASWQEYARGRTPSPCLRCNEKIKFGLLLDWARRLGFDALATGHYARIVQGPDDTIELWRGVDAQKDQAYFLAGLSAEQLAATRFPLGGLTKAEVRHRAAAAGLPNADAPESQDACLVTSGETFAETLRIRFEGKTTPGVVIDDAGKILGTHAGVHRFTIGQRRGLGIQSLERSWVRHINGDDGTVTVTHDPERLAVHGLSARNVHWISPQRPRAPLSCEVQVRHHQRPSPAELRVITDDRIELTVDRPLRAVAPGQAAVLYQGARVLGRGWIDATTP